MDLKGVRERAADRLLAIFAHNHNEVTRMGRAVQAQQLGLPASEFATPYPGERTSSNTVINHNGVGAKGIMAVVAASGLLAGGAGVAGVRLAAPAVQQVAPAPVVATTAPATLAPDGMIIQEERQRDGSWKFLWSLPAKRLPDGTAQTMDGRKWRPGKDGNTWEEAQ